MEDKQEFEEERQEISEVVEDIEDYDFEKEMEEEGKRLLEIDIFPSKFECSNTTEWEKAVELNKEPYGRACIVFAHQWAVYMEEFMNQNNQKDFTGLTEEQIEDASRRADSLAGGITGFMYGAAVAVLFDTWKYGHELNLWHNTKYGHPEMTDSTINPALMVVGG